MSTWEFLLLFLLWSSLIAATCWFVVTSIHLHYKNRPHREDLRRWLR